MSTNKDVLFVLLACLSMVVAVVAVGMAITILIAKTLGEVWAMLVVFDLVIGLAAWQMVMLTRKRGKF